MFNSPIFSVERRNRKNGPISYSASKLFDNVWTACRKLSQRKLGVIWYERVSVLAADVYFTYL